MGYNAIDALSRSEYISINDILENPEIPWNYTFVSMNPNITWVEINKYSEIPWNYNYICSNKMSCPIKCKRYKSIYDSIIKEINYLY